MRAGQTLPAEPRMRFLPRGSMRRQRRRGQLEGAAAMLVLFCGLGAAMVAAMPAELYRAAPATVRPLPHGTPAPHILVEIPPCLGNGKDCSTDADPETLRAPNVAQQDPAARPLPEPGTLALIGAGIAALAWRKT